MGPEHLNKFMANINIPGINTSAMKKRQDEVFPHIQNLAQNTFAQALDEEISLTLADNRYSVSYMSPSKMCVCVIHGDR